MIFTILMFFMCLVILEMKYTIHLLHKITSNPQENGKRDTNSPICVLFILFLLKQ